MNDENDPAYVKNRTHWVERPYEPIVWDGNTEGRDSVDLSLAMGYPAGSVIAYKISDHVLTLEEIGQSTVYAAHSGKTESSGFEEPIIFVEGAIWLADYGMSTKDEYGNEMDFASGSIVCTAIAGDFTDAMGVVIPSVGTYTFQNLNVGVGAHSVEIRANDVYHRISEEYLPQYAKVAYTGKYSDLAGTPLIGDTEITLMSPNGSPRIITVSDNGELLVDGAVPAGAVVQADWGENDPTSPAYVKNRTHYIAQLFDVKWDGDMTDKVSIPLDGFGFPGRFFVHVYGYVYNADELSYSRAYTSKGDIIYNNGYLVTEYPGVIAYSDMSVAVVNDSELFAETFGIQVPTGTYFACAPSDGEYVARLVGRDYHYPLNEEYLMPLNRAYPEAATKAFLFHLFSGEVPQSAFAGDNSIEHVKTSTFVTIGNGAFRGCENLVDVELPKVKRIGSYTFSDCKALTMVDFSELEGMGINVFSHCNALTTVILRNTSDILARSISCPFSSNTFIYVPSNLINGYHNHWGGINDNFRALEDYTVDGTITGDLDETKI